MTQKTIENPLEKLGAVDGMNSMLGTQEMLAKQPGPAEKKPKKEGDSSSDEEDDHRVSKLQNETAKKALRADFVMPKPLTEQEILQQTGVYNMILNKRQQHQAGKKGSGGAIVPPKNPFNAGSKIISDASKAGAQPASEKGSGKSQGFEVEFQGKPRYEISNEGHTEAKEEAEEHYEEGNIDISDNNSFLNSLSNQFEEISMNHSSTQLESSNPPLQQNISSQNQVTNQDNGKNLNILGENSKLNARTEASAPGIEVKTAGRKDSRPKMTMRYSFFCQKLNGDYVINSEDLFQTDLGVF